MSTLKILLNVLQGVRTTEKVLFVLLGQLLKGAEIKINICFTTLPIFNNRVFYSNHPKFMIIILNNSFLLKAGKNC